MNLRPKAGRASPVVLVLRCARSRYLEPSFFWGKNEWAAVSVQRPARSWACLGERPWRVPGPKGSAKKRVLYSFSRAIGPSPTRGVGNRLKASPLFCARCMPNAHPVSNRCDRGPARSEEDPRVHREIGRAHNRSREGISERKSLEFASVDRAIQ